MANIPLTPHLKNYRGSKEALRRKTAAFNAMAHRVADHVNTLMANNPSEIQQYHFYEIAHDLGLSVDDVRSAISDGGYNGITLGVRDEGRQALACFKRG